MILRPLSSIRKSCVRTNQGGFRVSRGCIDHIFTLRQIKHRRMFSGPMISVFPNLQAAFNSVDCTVLWYCPSLKCAPGKFIPLIQSLYSNNPTEFAPTAKFHPSSLRESVSLVNFVIEMVMEIALSSCENSSTDNCLDSKLSDLEYVDDVVLVSEDRSKFSAIV